MITILGYDIARKNEQVKGSDYEHITFELNVSSYTDINRLRDKLKELHQCDVFLTYKEK